MKKSLLRLATATLVATATSTAFAGEKVAIGVSITLERLFGGVTERLRRACKTPVIYAN